MFFIICFGLGSPTLERYDPSQTASTSDSLDYYRLVVVGPSAAQGHWRYRILVPYLARPIYILKEAGGHFRTWNSVAFSLLVVNSAFCASSLVVLMLIGKAFGLPFATALMAAFVYLLNYTVSNEQLSGGVDSVEAFLMVCLMLALRQRSWNALPVLGVLGGLGKETFLPLAFLFACGWVWRGAKRF